MTRLLARLWWRYDRLIVLSAITEEQQRHAAYPARMQAWRAELARIDARLDRLEGRRSRVRYLWNSQQERKP